MVSVKYIIVLALLAGTIAVTNAQGVQELMTLRNATPQKRAQFQTDEMKSKLSLTGEQLAKVKPINLKYAVKFEPILKSRDDKDIRIKAAMGLQADKDAELKAIFTAAQFKIYRDYEQQLEDRFKSFIN